MKLIGGRAIAAAITAEVTATAAGLTTAGTAPTLAVVVPTDDEATAWYVRSIQRAAANVGITCQVDILDHPDGNAITKHLDALSADPAVHGVICQTPLPAGVSLDAVGAHIDPAKDVDGANPESLGRLAVGLPTYPPATAAAVLEILHHEQIPLTGTRAVVVGRSTVVGKPAALLLLAENATVTVCHSRTVDLPAVCAQADVLVAAIGRTHLIGAAYIKPGAVVIDVGTNPTPDGGLAGDVDPDGSDQAAALTPVPGGVGPVTTMLLMRHTAHAAANQQEAVDGYLRRPSRPAWLVGVVKRRGGPANVMCATGRSAPAAIGHRRARLSGFKPIAGRCRRTGSSRRCRVPRIR